LVALTPELCLDGPIFPVLVERYQVNALVGVWKFEQSTNSGGDIAQRPDVPEDGSVFRLGLEVELDEPLERATHLGFGESPRSLPKSLPGGARGDKTVHAVH
jgi:hypothetical protein